MDCTIARVAWDDEAATALRAAPRLELDARYADSTESRCYGQSLA